MNQGVRDFEELEVSDTLIEPSSSYEVPYAPKSPPVPTRIKDNKAAYLKEHPDLAKKDVNWVDWRQHQGREIISATHQDRPVRQFLPDEDFEELYSGYKPIKKRVRSPEKSVESPAPPVIRPRAFNPIDELDNFGDDNVVESVLKPKKFKF